MEGAHALPAPDPDEAMPKDLQELAGYMRQHYVEAGDWWDNKGLPGLQDQALPTICWRTSSRWRAWTKGPWHERPAVAVQRQQVRQQGLIAGLVTLPFRLFGVLCGSLLLCIVIECIGICTSSGPSRAGVMRRAC